MSSSHARLTPHLKLSKKTLATINAFQEHMSKGRFKQARDIYDKCQSVEDRYLLLNARALYWASWYGNMSMVNFILDHCKSDESKNLFHTSQAYANSSQSGNLTFVQGMFIHAKKYCPWLNIQEGGRVLSKHHEATVNDIKQNIACVLNKKHTSQTILAIWNWQASVMPISIIQAALDELIPDSFIDALLQNKIGCATWLYQHANDTARADMLEALRQSEDYAHFTDTFNNLADNSKEIEASILSASDDCNSDDYTDWTSPSGSASSSYGDLTPLEDSNSNSALRKSG